MDDESRRMIIYDGPPRWARVVLDALEASGIPASVPPQISSIDAAYLGPSASACVAVRPEDEGRARAVLADLEAREPEAFPSADL